MDADLAEFDSPEFDPPESDSPDLDSPPFDSPPFDSPPFDSPDLDSPEVDPADGESPDFESPDFAWSPFTWSAAAFFVGAPEDRLSFLAQPLPLKWIVGGANARTTGPSQRGHWWGPDSLRPRMTSNRWPQELQT